MLAALLTLGLAFPLAPTVSAQAASHVATGEARSRLAALASLLEPSQFDLDELALAMAFEDPEYITAWVADSLRYEVYRGLLRGPQGTLVAKAGNALDQAVLLARLLGDAGFDARVLLGQLSDEDALELVMSMFTDARAEGGAEPAQEPGFEDLAAATGTDEQALSAAIAQVAGTELRDLPAFHDASAQAQALLTGLGQVPERDATQDLIGEAKEYAWVEYRLGEGDSWTVAHPAWPVEAVAPQVAATGVLEAEVPADLLHHLRIEVTIERKRGEVFEEERLMTPWQRPVANLLGETLTVGNTVLGENGASDLAKLGSDIVAAAFYAPVLNGSLAPGAMAFDLQGNLVPPDVASSAMAGVFQTTSSRLGDAAGALGGLGSDEPVQEVFALTAQWIDFVLVAPGGEETRHRRVVFDRRAPGARAAGTSELLDESVLLENLISTYVVMATGGGVSPAYVASELHEQAEFHLDVTESLADLRASGSVESEEVALLEALGDYVPNDHLKLFAASDAINQELAGVAYRSEPSLIALVGTVTPTAEVRATAGVDVIANAKRTLRLTDGGVHYDVEGGLLAGAWDTVIERDFVEGAGRPATNAVGPDRAVGLVLVTSADSAGLLAAGVPLHALSAVRNDMKSGYAIMVSAATREPTAESTAEPAAHGSAADWAYWRVDVATGETLGMDAAGRGGAMAEFIVGLQVGLTVNAALAVPGLIMCHSSGAPWQCYCDTIATGVILSFAGALVGAFAGANAVLMYALVDIGVVAPVTTIFTPPICSAITGSSDRFERAGGASSVCWAA